MVGGPFGNQHAVKLSTPELKAQAYEQYCDHLSKGKSLRSWHFEHPDLTLTSETMEKYIKENPVDFDPIKKQLALTKGFAIWEEHCEKGAKGEVRKINTPMTQMVMRNKFGWDKYHKDQEEEKAKTNEANVNKLLDNWTADQPTIGTCP